MSPPRLPPDFADLFVCLAEAGVEYMLVGGYAVMAHGYLRATQDLDVHQTAQSAMNTLVTLAQRLPEGGQLRC